MEANNMAAMREALENSGGLLEELAKLGEWGESAREQIAENKAALAAAPRNCDIGTEVEQAERFAALCNSNKCPSCPCRFAHKTDCALHWAHMPYEEGGNI